MREMERFTIDYRSIYLIVKPKLSRHHQLRYHVGDALDVSVINEVLRTRGYRDLFSRPFGLQFAVIFLLILYGTSDKVLYGKIKWLWSRRPMKY